MFGDVIEMSEIYGKYVCFRILAWGSCQAQVSRLQEIGRFVMVEKRCKVRPTINKNGTLL